MNGLFNLTDGLFVLLATVGLLWFWRRHPARRSRVLWPVLYCALIFPIVFYRGLWHYFVLYLSIGAAFYAAFLTALLDRFLPRRFPRNSPWPLAAALAITLLIHAVSLLTFVNAKSSDILAYRQNIEAYADAQSLLSPHARAAVLLPPDSTDTTPWQSLHGASGEWARDADDFRDLLDTHFILAPNPAALTDSWCRQYQVEAVLFYENGAARVQPLAEFLGTHNAK